MTQRTVAQELSWAVGDTLHEWNDSIRQRMDATALKRLELVEQWYLNDTLGKSKLKDVKLDLERSKPDKLILTGYYDGGPGMDVTFHEVAVVPSFRYDFDTVTKRKKNSLQFENGIVDLVGVKCEEHITAMMRSSEMI